MARMARGSIRREVVLFGIAYAGITLAVLWILLMIKPPHPYPTGFLAGMIAVAIVCGITAVGAFTRKRWTPVFALTIHGAIVLGGVIATIADLGSDQAKKNIALFLLSRFGLLLIYSSMAGFWLRPDVRASFRTPS